MIDTNINIIDLLRNNDYNTIVTLTDGYRSVCIVMISDIDGNYIPDGVIDGLNAIRVNAYIVDNFELNSGSGSSDNPYLVDNDNNPIPYDDIEIIGSNGVSFIINNPECDITYRVNVRAKRFRVYGHSNDSEIGFVQGSHYVSYGESVNLSAMFNPNLRDNIFNGWTDDDNDNELLTLRSVLSLTSIDRDWNVTANFNRGNVTITARTNDGRIASRGVYSPIGIATTDGETSKTYIYGETAHLHAEPSVISVDGNDYYVGDFIGWVKTDYLLTATLSETLQFPQDMYRYYSFNTDIDVIAENNDTYWAVFAPRSATITTDVNNPSYGSTSGGGLYLVGSQITLNAIPNQNYEFTQWDDGNSESSRMITVVDNATYTACFVESESPDNGYTLIMYIVSPSGVLPQWEIPAEDVDGYPHCTLDGVAYPIHYNEYATSLDDRYYVRIDNLQYSQTYDMTAVNGTNDIFSHWVGFDDYGGTWSTTANPLAISNGLGSTMNPVIYYAYYEKGEIPGKYPPKADFNIQTGEGYKVLITNLSENYTQLSWVYEGANVQDIVKDELVGLVYSAPGTYTITLTAKNEGFPDSISTKTITII